MGETAYEEKRWLTADGLNLAYRDYSGPRDRPPILCIPGLTRNARDFEPLAGRFAGEWRMICPDMRGRGQSDYARDPSTYAPRVYVEDLEALLLATGITRFVAIGTSLGGILTMLLALAGPGRIAGAVLNDIGPQVEENGLARIREYVGQGRSYPTWIHAARGLQQTMGEACPHMAVQDWLRMAKRLMAIGQNGRIAFDYDMKIAEPFNQSGGAVGADMWPAWQALSGRPLLVLRGAHSDILSDATLARMVELVPGAEAVTIPGVGHAPTLEEPEALEAIARLLETLA